VGLRVRDEKSQTERDSLSKNKGLNVSTKNSGRREERRGEEGIVVGEERDQTGSKKHILSLHSV